MFRVVIPAVNRRRRIALVKAMQGISTAVFGGEAWREVCTGTIRYAGQVPYADVAERLTTARVCLAWGPTQFTHSFSERVLLSMAAGCATVADDRLFLRRHFVDRRSDGACLRLFDAAAPASARAAVEQVLNDREASLAMAVRGRRAIKAAHLWRHRVDTLLAQTDHAAAA